jgi:hypothetical protein
MKIPIQNRSVFITFVSLGKTIGPVAERLGRALQKLVLQFESGRDL